MSAKNTSNSASKFLRESKTGYLWNLKIYKGKDSEENTQLSKQIIFKFLEDLQEIIILFILIYFILQLIYKRNYTIKVFML